MGSFNSSIKNRRGRNRQMPVINVTPLVDVMLVLLIIFMVTSPMLVAGINIDLPQSNADAVAGQDEPLSIDVDAHGKIFMQQNLIKEEELIAKLKAVSKEKMDIRILVRGDKAVDYGKVINTLGLISSAGFSKVALVTEQHETLSKK